jgi:hypothetical protein
MTSNNRSSWITKIIAIVLLGLLGWGATELCKLFVPQPWHWIGVSAPFWILILLGSLGSSKTKR